MDARASTIRLLTVFTGIIAAILVIGVLKNSSDVFLPIIVAMLLARLFEPLINRLERMKIPLGVTIVIVLLGATAIIGGVGAVILICAQQLAATLPLYQDKANAMIQGIGDSLSGILVQMGADVKTLDMSHSIDPNTIVSILTAGFTSAVDFLSAAVLVIILMLMIIGGQRSLYLAMKVGYGRERAAQVREFLVQVDSKVQRFLVAKTLVNLLTGAATYVILLAFGVDLAFVFAVIAFFFSYIPAIGGLVALILPIGMGALQLGTGGVFVGLVIALVATNLIIDRVIEPKVMGRSVDLSPLIVFLAFMIFSWMWGSIGAILAVPITAIIKVTFENIPSLRPLALIMSESPDSD